MPERGGTGEAWHDLSGKVALVTGGNAGIGLGLARGLVNAGAEVMLWGTNAERNRQAVASLGDASAASQIDVRDEQAVSAGITELVNRFGRLDCCFANAGVPTTATPTPELSAEQWRSSLAINLDGTFLTLKTAAAQLRAQGDGGSLVVTSSLGAFDGMPQRVAYSAAKGAVLALVRSLAVELGRDSITVNALVPGWIETAMTAPVLSDQASNSAITRRIPLRRLGTPADFEAAAVFLAGSGARYLTGQQLVIDGGYSVF